MTLHVSKMGCNTLLAKIDIEHAYRNIPIPHDRELLGMSWKGGLYIDAALPFGLRYTPKKLFGGGRCGGMAGYSYTTWMTSTGAQQTHQSAGAICSSYNYGVPIVELYHRL